MKKFPLFLLIVFSWSVSKAQMDSDSMMVVKRDSSLRAMIHTDSMKIQKGYEEQVFWKKLLASAIYPAINAGDYSGVIPVKNPTEIPDAKMDFKLLFEVTIKNPDSTSSEINYGLTEVARIINLHVASGIPISKIFPVVVVHGGALYAISTNEKYKSRYNKDNPSIKTVENLQKLGTKFIACGQAMAFLKFTREDLLPVARVSVTAQTALSNYQLKGYIKYVIDEARN